MTIPFTNKTTYYLPPKPADPSQEEIDRAKDVLARADVVEKLWRKGVLLNCGSCRNMQPLAESVRIQTHYYTPPRGCTGGDYWSTGEVQVPCNACGIRMRLNFECKELQQPEWENAFGSHENEY